MGAGCAFVGMHLVEEEQEGAVRFRHTDSEQPLVPGVRQPLVKHLCRREENVGSRASNASRVNRSSSGPTVPAQAVSTQRSCSRPASRSTSLQTISGLAVHTGQRT